MLKYKIQAQYKSPYNNYGDRDVFYKFNSKKELVKGKRYHPAYYDISKPTDKKTALIIFRQAKKQIEEFLHNKRLGWYSVRIITINEK